MSPPYYNGFNTVMKVAGLEMPSDDALLGLGIGGSALAAGSGGVRRVTPRFTEQGRQNIQQFLNVPNLSNPADVVTDYILSGHNLISEPIAETLGGKSLSLKSLLPLIDNSNLHASGHDILRGGNAGSS